MIVHRKTIKVSMIFDFIYHFQISNSMHSFLLKMIKRYNSNAVKISNYKLKNIKEEMDKKRFEDMRKAL